MWRVERASRRATARRGEAPRRGGAPLLGCCRCRIPAALRAGMRRAGRSGGSMRAGAVLVHIHAGSTFSRRLWSTNWRRTSMSMMPRGARARATPKPGDVQAMVLWRLFRRGSWPPWTWRWRWFYWTAARWRRERQSATLLTTQTNGPYYGESIAEVCRRRSRLAPGWQRADCVASSTARDACAGEASSSASAAPRAASRLSSMMRRAVRCPWSQSAFRRSETALIRAWRARMVLVLVLVMLI